MRSPNFPYYKSDIKLQTRYILENLKKTFEAAGSSLDQVFKAQVFLTDLGNFNGFDVWKEYFKVPPARTTVGTTGLLVKDTLVEIDLIGCLTGTTGRRSNRVRPSRLRITRRPSISAVCVRRRTAQRFQVRRPGGGAAAPEPLLQLRHQAADPLRAGESQEDVRSRRQPARQRRQGAGLSYRSQQLQRLRRSVEGVFQGPAAAHDHRNDRPAGEDTLVEIDRSA